MYVVELSLRLSPMPLSVQRRELEDARALYQQLRQAIETGEPRLIELTCDKEDDKRISLLSGEILALQLYEKSAGAGGKRPGFSIDA
ncbi:MAG: hypothetical protein VKM01_05510 [Cyanobacteriota bacterium]|nr:hypothetical protein [Cyanobacteriota bacterium]